VASKKKGGGGGLTFDIPKEGEGGAIVHPNPVWLEVAGKERGGRRGETCWNANLRGHQRGKKKAKRCFWRRGRIEDRIY